MDDGHLEQTVYTAPSPHDVPNEPYEESQGNSMVMRFPDGSAIVGNRNQLDESQQNPHDHDQNLALVLPEYVLKDIGNSLKMAIQEDISSQETYLEGVGRIIELLGIQLTGEANKEDLPFKGATSIYSMALFESALDLLATAMSSLFPSAGMVDSVILGESDQELRDVSYRKSAFFNYFLTQIAKEFKKESKRTLLWAILCGSCYKKVYIDPVLGRPTSMFIRPEDFIVNCSYSTHLAASRKTQILHIDGRDLQIRKLTGLYRDISIMKQDSYREEDSEIQDSLDEISGRTHELYKDDEIYRVYESHVDYRLKEDILAPEYDLPLPYVISIDEKSGNVLSIRRNWDKNDFLKKKREYFVNYSLLTSLEGEGYGLVNYAGRMAEAATSITRQLINTGTYANFPGGVYQAGIRLENNNLRPAPGEYVPIQTGGLPIRDAIDSLPYKEPSPALKELLNMIEDNIKKPSAIINSKVAEMAPRAPMGSVLAMLESMQKVPNAILQGFHESFQEELMLFNERFKEWLPDNKPYPFRVPGGEHAIVKSDFENNVMVVPSSDPSLQNSSYRFMQSEIILTNAQKGADIHNMRFAYEYFYKNMGLSPEDIQQLLPPPAPPAPPEEGPKPQDPITENQHLMTKKPVKAGIDQDHQAHMTVHSMLAENPDQEISSAAKAHIAEHQALQFLVEMQAKMGFEMPEDPMQIPPEMQNKIAIKAAHIVQKEMEEQKAATPPPPEPPLDPARVELEAVHSQAESAREKHEIERQKLQLEHYKLEREYEIQEQKLVQQAHIEELKSALDDKKMELENAVRERDLAIKEAKELHQQQPIIPDQFHLENNQ